MVVQFCESTRSICSHATRKYDFCSKTNKLFQDSFKAIVPTAAVMGLIGFMAPQFELPKPITISDGLHMRQRLDASLLTPEYPLIRGRSLLVYPSAGTPFIRSSQTVKKLCA